MKNLHVIVGLGATGLSCAKYLSARGVPVAVTDSRKEPPGLAELKIACPSIQLSLGEIDESLLRSADKIVLSPGVALREEKIAAQIKRGTPVVGDIELFAQAVIAPVIAITGTNAKSTVTTVVGKMAEAAGFRVAVGGNLGVPALDLLTAHQDAEVFVLELSSFQLETTYSLKPAVATVLNISPDHMDRYDDLQAYQEAKRRVYQYCNTAICNRDDPLTDYDGPAEKYYFSLYSPAQQTFGLLQENNAAFLAYENNPILPVTALPVSGRHYQANALASLAIGHAFGLPYAAMTEVLRSFKGLPHRCQFVRERQNVKWYNDSKGTNVGATIAAIDGLGSETQGKLVVIAGGVGKHADFKPLASAIKKYARCVILIGEAAQEIALAIGEAAPVTYANDMQEAIEKAAQAAKPNDSVLLSPACASFDMFQNYAHRGEVFTKLVAALEA